MSLPHEDQHAKFLSTIPANEGWWEYKTPDGDLLCYTVRTWDSKNNKKVVSPWTFQNEKWVNKFRKGVKEKPIYKVHLLPSNPQKTVMIVEGEKTADAAALLFPEYLCITWLGGSGVVKHVNLDLLTNQKYILVPDNDEPGYKVMDYLYTQLRSRKKDVAMVSIQNLGVSKGWDVADLNDEQGEIDVSDAIDLIKNTPFNNKDLPIFKKIMDPQAFPDLSEKSNPINTSENIEALCKFYGVDIRFNMMSRRINSEAEGQTYSLQNKNDCFFTYLSNLCVRNRVPKVDLANHLIFIADKHRYHPAVDWIESKPWDGVNRIPEFLNTITTDNQEDSNKLIYRWMIGCIAALYTPDGVSLEGMLVVQGEQKIGKSYWFINLVPKDKRALIMDGEATNFGNKDDVILVTGRWLVELAELKGTIQKSSEADLKRFITTSADQYRVPFGRIDGEYPRMTSLFGSVNDQDFLKDPTGNRRFWCISATKINYSHGMDMQQVWAEFKKLFDDGETYRLTDEEQNLVNRENEGFTAVHPLEEAIVNAFDWDSPDRNYPMQAIQVLGKLGITIDKPQINAYSQKIASILRKLTKTKGRFTNKKKVYDMPYCFKNEKNDYIN